MEQQRATCGEASRSIPAPAFPLPPGRSPAPRPSSAGRLSCRRARRLEFFDEKGFTVGNYTQLLSTRFFNLMVNTVVLGFGSAMLATAAGTIFAWLCVRTDLPFRKAFTILHIALYGLPTIAAALAWIFLLTPKAGLFNRFLMWLFGLQNAA